MRRERRQGKTLILPEIVRPRSVPFGEPMPRKDHRKTRQRQRCLRYGYDTLFSPPPRPGKKIRLESYLQIT